MPAVSGRAAVQPDTGHDLRPCRVLLGLGLGRGYERGGCIAVTGDRASTCGAVSPPGAEIERESTSCPGKAPAESVAVIATSDRSALRLPSTGRTQARGGARFDALADPHGEPPHAHQCGDSFRASACTRRAQTDCMRSTVSRSCGASVGSGRPGMEQQVQQLPELMTNFRVTQRHRGGLLARGGSASSLPI